MWHGKGTLERARGERYVGEFVAGKRSGTGSLWLRHEGHMRKRYEGQWLDGLPHGRGTHNYPNGDQYYGEWQAGGRHCVGVHRYASHGSIYEGDWLHNKRHGFGVYDYPGGSHFEGLWVEDKKEGEGVHFYYDGHRGTHTKRYDGEWVDDAPKCGFYTELNSDDTVTSHAPVPVPRTDLLSPDTVLKERITGIRAVRAPVRARRVPLDERFTAEELAALGVAFTRVDVQARGAITFAELPQAFLQVGMEPMEEALQALLIHMHKAADNVAAATFSFTEFAQAADFLFPIEELDCD